MKRGKPEHYDDERPLEWYAVKWSQVKWEPDQDQNEWYTAILQFHTSTRGAVDIPDIFASYPFYTLGYWELVQSNILSRSAPLPEVDALLDDLVIPALKPISMRLAHVWRRCKDKMGREHHPILRQYIDLACGLEEYKELGMSSVSDVVGSITPNTASLLDVTGGLNSGSRTLHQGSPLSCGVRGRVL